MESWMAKPKPPYLTEEPVLRSAMKVSSPSVRARSKVPATSISSLTTIRSVIPSTKDRPASERADRMASMSAWYGSGAMNVGSLRRRSSSPWTAVPRSRRTVAPPASDARFTKESSVFLSSCGVVATRATRSGRRPRPMAVIREFHAMRLEESSRILETVVALV